MRALHQLIYLLNVTGGGADEKGEIGFLDVADANERTTRLCLHHLDLPKFHESIEALYGLVTAERNRHGKDAVTKTLSTKAIVDVQAHADYQTGGIVLQFEHPSGRSTWLSVDLAQVEELVRRMHAAKTEFVRPTHHEPN